MTSKFALISLLTIFIFGEASATSLPTGFSETVVNSALVNPTAMEFAPDGRLFVCQQTGELRVIKNGVLLATPFLTVSTDSNGERGLLGVAFDPDFANNQWVYIYYTVPGSPAHNRVSRFTANGDTALSGSEVVLVELDSLSSATNHNGGAIHFGLDGKLYIGVGENANSANAQTLDNRLGKILRINRDGSIPIDNPFYNTAVGVNRSIWALGLRNPFTFAVQPGTGRMFINDVGENTWEEIDDGDAGMNYGWSTCEGACSPSNPSYQNPVYQYSHAEGCAITGGVFYNPSIVQFPAEYVGAYFLADLCGAWIRVFHPDSGSAPLTFATGLSRPVDLKIAADGSLFYLDRGRSSVYQVRYSPPPMVTLTLVSDPVGLNLTLDGQTVTTPYPFKSAVGSTRTIGAPSSQRLNKTNYSFVDWSDGGAQTHSIVTPNSDTSYTAVYRQKNGRR